MTIQSAATFLFVSEATVDTLRQDLKHTFRQMRRQPLFHLAVALTLALGVGVNTALFSVVKAVLFDALPYPEPERLVRIWNRNDERERVRVDASLYDVQDWRRTRSVQALAVFNTRTANLSGGEGAERINYALVSPDFFRALGVAPARGRDFVEQDNVPGHDAVVLVSHAFWRDRLGGDPNAVGQTIRLDGVPTTVIGVMPAGFAFPQRDLTLWKPFGMALADAGPRGGRWVSVVARLRRGATMAEATHELEAVARANEQDFPESNRGWSTWIEPLHTVVVSDVRATLLLVWATVGLVLLIACANVTNLVLARGVGRRRELAVRSALGAGRTRIVAQLLLESGVLALAGGLLGVVLARPVLALVARLGETGLAGGAPPRLDGAVLLFALAISLLAGVLTGMVPANGSAAEAAGTALRARGTVGHAGRLRGALVTTQIALATALLIGAGLLVRSLIALRAVPVGVSSEQRLTLRVAPGWASMPERTQADALFHAIEAQIAALPGVNAVGAVNRLPLEGNWWAGGLTVRGRAPLPREQQPTVVNRIVTPGYFKAAGMRLLRGRLPNQNDRADGLRVMAISETLARQLWGPEDPVGSTVTNEDPEEARAPWYTVVGIVSDVRYASLASEPSAATYTTFAQARWGHFGDWGMGFVIATAGEPTSLIPSVRAAIASVDARLPIFQVSSMQNHIEQTLSAPRRTTQLLLGFGLLALVLAALGAYAVLSFTVSRQVPEMGLRMALGASAASVTILVLRRGISPALLGVVLGLGLAFAARPLLQQQLFQVAPFDPRTFLSVALLMMLVALLACLLPAWRASRLPPCVALGAE